MILSLSLALALSQTGYLRSRVTQDDPNSLCLYWPENSAIALHQNQDGNPEVGGPEFTAFQASITTWQTQLNACASVSLADGARTTSRATEFKTSGDNENVVVYRFKKCSKSCASNDTLCKQVDSADACWDADQDNCGSKYDCWQHASGAIAITTTSYYPSNAQILDADIEFNWPSFYFTATPDTVPCPTGVSAQTCVVTDVQNTATHELGHLLGLAHFTNSNSTMFASASTGETKKRTLDVGSAQFVCDTYPVGQRARQCVIPTVEETLGKAPKGCSVTAGGALIVLPLLFRRRRARA